MSKVYHGVDALIKHIQGKKDLKPWIEWAKVAIRNSMLRKGFSEDEIKISIDGWMQRNKDLDEHSLPR